MAAVYYLSGHRRAQTRKPLACCGPRQRRLEDGCAQKTAGQRLRTAGANEFSGRGGREHQPALILLPRDLWIQDAKGSRLPVSSPMAIALERLNQWYGLAAAGDFPITHQQLKVAALAPASVERIRALFEGAIRRGVRVSGHWLTPETGGEATIDSELRLMEARDPRWSTIQELISGSDDPNAVASMIEGRAFEIAQVDTHGLLKVAVGRFRLGAKGAADEIRRALLTVK